MGRHSLPIWSSLENADRDDSRTVSHVSLIFGAGLEHTRRLARDLSDLRPLRIRLFIHTSTCGLTSTAVAELSNAAVFRDVGSWPTIPARRLGTLAC